MNIKFIIISNQIKMLNICKFKFYNFKRKDNNIIYKILNSEIY